MQKRYGDSTPQLNHNFYGVRVDTLEISLTPAEIISCTASVMGKYDVMTEDQFSTAYDLPEDATTPMNTATNVNTILENGTTSNDLFNELSISISNNLRPLLAIGSLGPIDINYGVMDVTGSISYYFQNSSVYNRLVADSSFSISIRLQDETGLYYRVTLPRLKLESAEITAAGLDQDLTVDCQWRAMYDPASGCQIKIEKYDTVVPLFDEQWDLLWI